MREIGQWAVKAIFFFLIFVAISITVSYWTGFVSLNTPLILVSSLLLSLYLFKKFEKSLEIKLPFEVLLLSLIALALCTYPLLLVHPFYMAGNDTLHTTTLRTLQLNGKIPETYAPFASISFTYLVGFHLFAKIFADLMPFAPDYLILWFFGAIFASLQVILVYLFSLEIFKSRRVAFFASLLFIGTKDLYQHMFFGLFPREAAACFFFAAFFLILRKNRLALVFLPALAMLHSGFMLIFAVCFSLFLALKRKFFMLHYLPSLILALPAFYQSYAIPLFGYAATSIAGGLNTFNPVTRLFSLALWSGWVPITVFIIAFFFTAFKKSFNREKIFGLALMFSGLAIYFFLEIRGSPVNNVVVWLFTLGGILFSALTLSEIKMNKKLFRRFSALLVVLCLMSFFASGYLQSRINKNQSREAEFAFKFWDYDPGLEPTVIIVKGGKSIGKIAELACKIPYNAMEGLFLPISSVIIRNDKGYFELLERQKLTERIIEEKCADCLKDLNVKYIVIDPAFAGFDLNAEPLLEVNGIKLYAVEEIK